MPEPPFPDFFGNAAAARTLRQMIERDRIAQTILLHGPEGIGKATLARRFAAALVGGASRIEQDDLSLPQNAEMLAEREKMSPEKRADDPLLLATHPDFVTFAPDGPLRQISIQQMRTLKERARFQPLAGKRRVFLIDGIDRANEQAANSLLKTLEEPPPYLILVCTAENAYDLLPTIRSRSIILRLGPLAAEDMDAFARIRRLDDPALRIALAAGSPGAAASIDLEAYRKRREAMQALLASASGVKPFGEWARYSEKLALARTEKLEPYLKVLYLLLADVLHLREGVGDLRNPDQRAALEPLARAVSFEWLRTAVHKTGELLYMVRRNIHKNIALDALVADLRALPR
jgi:DNA polymerase-3 subunit delta'